MMPNTLNPHVIETSEDLVASLRQTARGGQSIRILRGQLDLIADHVELLAAAVDSTDAPVAEVTPAIDEDEEGGDPADG